ncbi:MAG: AMP-binding protein [Betaproteobacteria bacterium]|nr:AMP-binding protein [Betaproteobacteria bacterium]
MLMKLNVRPIADTAEFYLRGYWQDRLIVDYVDEHAAAHPDKAALIDNRGTLTYGELVAQTRNLAAALVGLGIGSGDVVGVQAPNWAELPISHLALDRIGAIFLPLHDGFRHEELRNLLSQSRAKALIFPASYRGFNHRALVEDLRPGLPDLRYSIVMRAPPAVGELAFDALVWDDAWRGARGNNFLDACRPNASSPSQIMVSSGTTAVPRCSVFCDNAMVFKLVRQYGRYACHLGSDDIAAAIAPAGTGSTGYNYPILAPLLFGGTSILLERWNGLEPERALELIAAHRCTYAVVIPTQLVKLVNVPDLGCYDFSALRFITNGGAKLAATVAEAAERSFGCVVQTMYGSTDSAVPTMTSIDDPAEKRRTVGRVLEGQELRVVRDDGTPAEPGEPGEIWWRGANGGFGYLNAPEANKAVWDNEGWFHSGDIGVLDADGYLSITGRRKDMIIRGGRNINPRQIEEILVQHPKVTDAAVIPIGHAVLGEIACAVVVPASQQDSPSLEELNEFIRSKELAVWCQPEKLVLVDDFPRNAGGKVDKRALIASVEA